MTTSNSIGHGNSHSEIIAGAIITSEISQVLTQGSIAVACENHLWIADGSYRVSNYRRKTRSNLNRTLHVHGKVFVTYRQMQRQLLTTVGNATMIESRLSSEYTASTLTSPAAGGDGSMEKCELQCHTHPIALTHPLSLALQEC